MTVRPDLGHDLAEEVAKAYSEAELAILRRMADLLAKGDNLSDIDWRASKLANMQVLTREMLAELAKVNAQSAARIQAVMTEAYALGSASALSDMGKYATATSAISSSASRRAVEIVAAELVAKNESLVRGVLRAVPDIYQQVVGRAVESTLLGGQTRKQATQAALTDLLSKGILVSPEGGGRMSLTNYVTMATRTGTAQAAIAGHTATMLDNGLNFVIIQPGPRVCDICDVWCGIILSIDGSPAGTYTVQDLVTGEEIEIECEGSLEDAEADGWGHPNCRCGCKAYIPGATKTPEREPWDREGYEAQQRQREIERNIRDYKYQEALALDPAAEAAAAGKVSEWQGTMREHLDKYDYLKRQSDREQI